MTVRKSLGIVGATRVIVFLISLTSVIIVSRLLTPAEVGLFSVSVALVGIAHMFRDFGVSQYLIQLREMSEEKKRAAFTVTLLISWLIALAIYGLRGYAAAFYGNAAVAEILAFTAINFLILPIGAPLKTILHRDMQFGKLAVVSLSHHTVQAAATVYAAWMGASYMSLAWGSVAGTITNVLGMVIISPSGALQKPTFRGLGEVFRFGTTASASSIVHELGAGAPDMVFGRTLGFEAVGYFSRASGLISSLLGQLMYVVRTVYVPVFAKGRREGADSAAFYADASSMLLGLTVPAMALLAMLSPYLIGLMFGAQWDRSAPLARLLCIYALITAPYAIAESSLIASGAISALLRCRMLIESCRFLVLLCSIALPLTTVVALLGLVYLLQSMLFMRALKETIGLTASYLWRRIRLSYALIPFTLAPPALFIFTLTYAREVSDIWLVAISSLSGGFGWLCGVFLLGHPLKGDVSRISQMLIARMRGLF